MKPSEIFFDLVKAQFVPVLRAAGFQGAGRTFRKQQNECIQILNLQTSTSGGRCAANLAVAFTFLCKTDPSKITEAECDFRRRLSPSPNETDFWWDFGDGAATAQKNVTHLINTFEQVGIPFFTRFGNFPGSYVDISVNDLRTPSSGTLPGGATKVRYALVLAQIWQHLKQPAKSKEFLLYGLEVCGPMASSARGQMKQLLAEIESRIVDSSTSEQPR